MEFYRVEKGVYTSSSNWTVKKADAGEWHCYIGSKQLMYGVELLSFKTLTDAEWFLSKKEQANSIMFYESYLVTCIEYDHPADEILKYSKKLAEALDYYESIFHEPFVKSKWKAFRSHEVLQ